MSSTYTTPKGRLSFAEMEGNRTILHEELSEYGIPEKHRDEIIGLLISYWNGGGDHKLDKAVELINKHKIYEKA